MDLHCIEIESWLIAARFDLIRLLFFCFLISTRRASFSRSLRLSIRSRRGQQNALADSQLLLSALYVFGCAFRSVLPRADLQRIVVVDTPLSAVFWGRSVATVAELGYAAQLAVFFDMPFIFPLLVLGKKKKRADCDWSVTPLNR